MNEFTWWKGPARETYQTKPTKPSLPNQSCHSKSTSSPDGKAPQGRRSPTPFRFRSGRSQCTTGRQRKWASNHIQSVFGITELSNTFSNVIWGLFALKLLLLHFWLETCLKLTKICWKMLTNVIWRLFWNRPEIAKNYSSIWLGTCLDQTQGWRWIEPI